MLEWLGSPAGRDFLILVLPMLWAVVAAVVALLLYKTSGAVLHGLEAPGVPLKGLRLAGSAVIFVVVFLLLQSGTKIEPVREGTFVPSSELRAIVDSAERIETSASDLAACARIYNELARCQAHLQSVRDEAGRLQQTAARTSSAAPAPKGD